jgi:hypothetical protein
MLIEYYTFIFGTGKLKPKDDDIRMIRKLETMRDATVLEEEFMGGITKSK